MLFMFLFRYTKEREAQGEEGSQDQETLTKGKSSATMFLIMSHDQEHLVAIHLEVLRIYSLEHFLSI
jgi:hypothetical protein